MSDRPRLELQERHGLQAPSRHAGEFVVHVRQRPVTFLLALAGGLLFLIDVALQSLDSIVVINSEVWFQFVRLMDLNAESSLPTWFAVIQLIGASLIALTIAIDRGRTGDPHARYWFLLAVLVAGFSLDEAAQIHDAPSREPLRDMLGTGGLLRYPWVVAAILSAVILAAVMFRFVTSLPAATRWQLILSALVFGAGAVGTEMVSGWYADSYPDNEYGYQMLTSIEELFELAGGTILIYALLGYARNWTGDLRIVWGGATPRDDVE